MSPPSLGGATGGDESEMKVTKSEKTQNRTAKSLGSVTELMTSLGSSEVATSGPTTIKTKKTKSYG